MKRTTKISIIVIVTITLFFSFAITINSENKQSKDYVDYYDSNNGMDRYNNTSIVLSKFQITNGVAIIDADYSGYLGVTTGAVIESKIQKKILFWWFDVNNGQTNNTWVDTFSTWYGRTQHTLGISESGSYRAVIKYTISGSGGSDDIIEDIVYP